MQFYLIRLDKLLSDTISCFKSNTYSDFLEFDTRLKFRKWNDRGL